MTAEASVRVQATSRSVLEFVLDLDRYREVDPKIVRVGSMEGPDAQGRGSVRLWARMPWLPPAPDRHDFVLDRWERVTFIGAARQPARWVFDFTGVIECTSDGDYTTVTHRYEFHFHGPFRLVERRLDSWLQQQIHDEMFQLAERIDGSR